jgi:hypothetical protein
MAIIIVEQSTQGCIIRNGGGKGSNEAGMFLQQNAKHFNTVSDGPYATAYYIRQTRVAKFMDYAISKGMEIVRRDGPNVVNVK